MAGAIVGLGFGPHGVRLCAEFRRESRDGDARLGGPSTAHRSVGWIDCESTLATYAPLEAQRRSTASGEADFRAAAESARRFGVGSNVLWRRRWNPNRADPWLGLSRLGVELF